MSKISGLILGIFVLMLLSACSTEGCYEDTESMLRVNLFETVDDANIEVDSISVLGLGSDTLYNIATKDHISLPLFASGTSSKFVIINGLAKDTLEIIYSSNNYYISKECGYKFNYLIEKIGFTKHKLDTVLIINDNVTTNNEENLRAFY